MPKGLVIALFFLALPGVPAAADLPHAPAPFAPGPVAAYAAGRVEGSGRTVIQVRDVGGFSAVRVRGSVDVELKAAAQERVSVRADDNLLELVETRVVPGNPPTLEIGIARGVTLKSRAAPVVIVEFTRLQQLALDGSGNTTVDRLRGDSLDVAIAGSGSVAIDRAELAALGVKIAGSGDFAASGRAEEQRFGIAGSGNVAAEKLAGKQASVSIAGSGNARVNVERTLEVRIAGSGDVVYLNDPVVTRRVTGSGSVRQQRD